MFRFMKGDEAPGVLLSHVEFVGSLVLPSLDKDQPVRIVRAGEEVVGKASWLDPLRTLHLGGIHHDIVARARPQLQGDDELIPPRYTRSTWTVRFSTALIRAASRTASVAIASSAVTGGGPPVRTASAKAS
jgi:hypothetical protein